MKRTVLLLACVCASSLLSIQAGSPGSSLQATIAERVAALEREIRVPVGSVVAYAGHKNGIPPGWKLCDGTTVKPGDVTSEQYEALGYALGHSYGGDENDAIVLPDFMGVFLRGVDGTGNSKRDPGERTGQPGWINDTVGSIQYSATALPTHPFLTGRHLPGGQVAFDGGGQILSFSGSKQSGGEGKYFSNSTNPGGSFTPEVHLPHHQHTILVGGDEETRPINKAVYWIIRIY